MNIDHLTTEQKAELLRQFRLAVMHRAAQWDAERAMEVILGEDTDVDVSHYAVMIDDPTEEGVSHLMESHLISALSPE